MTQFLLLPSGEFQPDSPADPAQFEEHSSFSARKKTWNQGWRQASYDERQVTWNQIKILVSFQTQSRIFQLLCSVDELPTNDFLDRDKAN